MSWLSRKLDNLGSAAAGAVGGISLSQAPAFTQAYLQRLGGHIDEARLTVEGVASGVILPWLVAAERDQAVAELSLRLTQLEQFQLELLDSSALLRPLTLIRAGEWSIAERTLADFVPAIPLDPASLTWTAVGVILALLIYELIKAPLALLIRSPRPAADSVD
ncbi:MAG: DUF2937 family protein [Pseudomonadota bacterium]